MEKKENLRLKKSRLPRFNMKKKRCKTQTGKLIRFAFKVRGPPVEISKRNTAKWEKEGSSVRQTGRKIKQTKTKEGIKRGKD